MKHIDIIGPVTDSEVLSYCVVRMSPAYLQQLLDLIKEVQRLIKKYDNIYSIERFDYVPSWYTFLDPEKFDVSEDDCKRLDQQEQWVRIGRYPSHDCTYAVDIPQVVVTDHSIYYIASPKHAPDAGNAATVSLNVQQLREYAEELKENA